MHIIRLASDPDNQSPKKEDHQPLRLLKVETGNFKSKWTQRNNVTSAGAMGQDATMTVTGRGGRQGRPAS